LNIRELAEAVGKRSREAFDLFGPRPTRPESVAELLVRDATQISHEPLHVACPNPLANVTYALTRVAEFHRSRIAPKVVAMPDLTV
jgi:hypothetical protein